MREACVTPVESVEGGRPAPFGSLQDVLCREHCPGRSQVAAPPVELTRNICMSIPLASKTIRSHCAAVDAGRMTKVAEKLGDDLHVIDHGGPHWKSI